MHGSLRSLAINIPCSSKLEIPGWNTTNRACIYSRTGEILLKNESLFHPRSLIFQRRQTPLFENHSPPSHAIRHLLQHQSSLMDIDKSLRLFSSIRRSWKWAKL